LPRDPGLPSSHFKLPDVAVAGMIGICHHARLFASPPSPKSSQSQTSPSTQLGTRGTYHCTQVLVVIESRKLFCPSWPFTTALLICASQGATGMSHWCPAANYAIESLKSVSHQHPSFWEKWRWNKGLFPDLDREAQAFCHSYPPSDAPELLWLLSARPLVSNR
jgi:hypothetical protein